MIIDVIDLKLKTLQFNRSYDTARYNRGVKIYNNEYVKIQQVEEKEDKSYKIAASVIGNYDMYTTTLEIKGNLITKSSCTCEDYYKGNLCKHIIATSMETLEPHYASTAEGKKNLQKKRIEEAQKRLEKERKQHEYEMKYYEGLKTIELYKRNLKNVTSNNLDLGE